MIGLTPKFISFCLWSLQRKPTFNRILRSFISIAKANDQIETLVAGS